MCEHCTTVLTMDWSQHETAGEHLASRSTLPGGSQLKMKCASRQPTIISSSQPITAWALTDSNICSAGNMHSHFTWTTLHSVPKNSRHTLNCYTYLLRLWSRSSRPPSVSTPVPTILCTVESFASSRVMPIVGWRKNYLRNNANKLT